MGEFESGKWIIGLLIYFFIFFLIMVSVVNMVHHYNYAINQNINYTNPGFLDKNNFFSNERCEGTSKSMNFAGTIKCKKLIDVDNETCGVNSTDGIQGCTWENESNILGIWYRASFCGGNVNKTYYNITSSRRQFCEEATGIQTEALCEIFGCTWVNESLMAELSVTNGEQQVVTLWSTVKYMVSFRADIGLGQWNFIFIFIFFYIPFIMLLFAIYMALPVIH